MRKFLTTTLTRIMNKFRRRPTPPVDLVDLTPWGHPDLLIEMTQLYNESQKKLRDLADLKTRESVHFKPMRVPGGTTHCKITLPGKPKWQYDALVVEMECEGPVRIRAFSDGAPASTFELTVQPSVTSGVINGDTRCKPFKLLAVNGLRAELPLHVEFASQSNFNVVDLWANFRRPAFRVEDDMMVFHDTFYLPEPIRGKIEGTPSLRLESRHSPSAADVQY